MTELLNAKKVLTEYIDTQIKLDDEYSLGNEKYINGLTDAVRIIDKIINREIEAEAKYYGENTEETSDVID